MLANKMLTTPKHPKTRGGEHNKDGQNTRDKQRESKGTPLSERVQVSQGAPPSKLLCVVALEVANSIEHINIFEVRIVYIAFFKKL